MKASIKGCLFIFLICQGSFAVANRFVADNSYSAENNQVQQVVAEPSQQRLQAERSSLPADSAMVDPRIPSGETVDSLKADRDFSYLNTPSRDHSWWDRFWAWLASRLSRAAMEGEPLNPWMVFFNKVLPWIIAIAVVVLIIMKLSGTSFDSFLRRKAVAVKVPFAEQPGEDLSEPFQQRIEEALRLGNLRLAIRLYYLDTLRQLSLAGFIEWHPDKTNHYYIREIKSREIRERFSRLTSIFEYFWYGEALPREEDFETARAAFTELKGSIAAHRS